LKKNAKLGYIKVQTASGETGWLPSRALTSEAPPPPPAVAPAVVAETPAKSPQQLQAELDNLQTELQAIRQASANVLRIQAERDQLQESVISLRKELETALREKSVLNGDQKQAWFLIGGGVLFGGILLGVLLPRLSVRRRDDWHSF
jgi:SH3 domain protein